MERRRWLITVAAILLLGGGGFGACALTTDDAVSQGTYAKGSDDAGTPSVPEVPVPGTETPGTPDHPGVQVEREMPEVPVEQNEPPSNARHAQIVPAGEGEQCGSLSESCPAGELCCHVTAHCYPADCQDCCASLVNPPEPPPRLIPPGPPGPGPGEL